MEKIGAFTIVPQSNRKFSEPITGIKSSLNNALQSGKKKTRWWGDLREFGNERSRSYDNFDEHSRKPNFLFQLELICQSVSENALWNLCFISSLSMNTFIEWERERVETWKRSKNYFVLGALSRVSLPALEDFTIPQRAKLLRFGHFPFYHMRQKWKNPWILQGIQLKYLKATYC